MSNGKNIIILSEKSSGSSACQNLLAKSANIRHVAKTRHYENETLYWIKAAALLGKQQVNMVDSIVPFTRKQAKAGLITLLQDNLDGYTPPADDEVLIREGWQRLCKQYGPIFLEKSPHHLCQWSALELIMEQMRTETNVDFLVIGLIRNPMDTIYSQYQRWKSPPAAVEKQWMIAYQNLLRLKGLIGDQLVLVRYEDMVLSSETLAPVFQFCEVTTNSTNTSYFHRQSIQKWKQDRLFGFTLSEEAIALAETYGYTKDELLNETHPLWPLTQRMARYAYLATKPARNVALNIIEKRASLAGHHQLTATTHVSAEPQ